MKKCIVAAVAVIFVGLSLAYTYSDASVDSANTVLGCSLFATC